MENDSYGFSSELTLDAFVVPGGGNLPLNDLIGITAMLPKPPVSLCLGDCHDNVKMNFMITQKSQGSCPSINQLGSLSISARAHCHSLLSLWALFLEFMLQTANCLYSISDVFI
ncbi:hypothetical protein Q8A73_007002 [Channa argus]|nr:hypothetical protein Q8A73_007002 [Channa argus]